MSGLVAAAARNAVMPGLLADFVADSSANTVPVTLLADKPYTGPLVLIPAFISN